MNRRNKSSARNSKFGKKSRPPEQKGVERKAWREPEEQEGQEEQEVQEELKE